MRVTAGERDTCSERRTHACRTTSAPTAPHRRNAERRRRVAMVRASRGDSTAAAERRTTRSSTRPVRRLRHCWRGYEYSRIVGVLANRCVTMIRRVTTIDATFPDRRVDPHLGRTSASASTSAGVFAAHTHAGRREEPNRSGRRSSASPHVAAPPETSRSNHQG
jgi:hypothetical protein